MNLPLLESELKKRLGCPYNWGRKQSDEWDRKTKFIYLVQDFESLENQCKDFDEGLRNYAFNRWLNFWSAKAVEDIFASNSLVKKEANQFSKTVDFYISGIPFDHKSSVFPKQFGKSFDYAVDHKKELVEWLYNNQSQQGRKHLANRLFIIFYDENNGEHWKLKTQLSLIQEKITDYLSNFSGDNLVSLNLESHEILSDLIWIKA
ncbi:hypothetical protein ACFOWU_18345 [Epilithonimonas zeae]|uniref:Uncharacterized protein n=1 Tax=Epilithonimonas zeae TaxID=1416779 RepID=A0A1N6JIY4_9FLAO|nr:hypothetical protein [Epilithonimonas zeae]SIO44332.1 hypothetical protein SAMN05444409_3467 [Epilithonimonas zeae]